MPARTGTESVIQYSTGTIPDQKPLEEVACYTCLKCQEKFLSLSLFRQHFKVSLITDFLFYTKFYLYRLIGCKKSTVAVSVWSVSMWRTT